MTRKIRKLVLWHARNTILDRWDAEIDYDDGSVECAQLRVIPRSLRDSAAANPRADERPAKTAAPQCDCGPTDEHMEHEDDCPQLWYEESERLRKEIAALKAELAEWKESCLQAEDFWGKALARAEKSEALLEEWLRTPYFETLLEWQEWVEDSRPRVEKCVGGERESGSGMARVDAATKRPKPLSRQEAAANPAAPSTSPWGYKGVSTDSCPCHCISCMQGCGEHCISGICTHRKPGAKT